MSSSIEYRSSEEFQNRQRKLNEIRALNVEPYPHRYAPTHNASNLIQEFDKASIGHSEDAASGSTPLVCVAGRLVLFRSMGKNAFAQIQDETDRIQVMFNRDLTEVQGYTPTSLEGEVLTPLKFIEKKN